MATNNPYNVNLIFAEMEQELIASYKRNMARHARQEVDEGFKWGMWQVLKLQDLRQYQSEARRIIDKYNRRAKDAATGMVVDSYQDGEYVVDSVLKGRTTKTGTNSFSVINRRKLDSLLDAVNNDFDNASAAALRLVDDQFRKIIFRSQVMFTAGATALPQAIDMAARDFLNSGINAIEYNNGNRVNIASYAEMCLRATSKKAYLTGEGSKAAEWGVHLIQTTFHGASCDLCLPWQGKVLVDDVFAGGKPDGKHPLLSAAMAQGLYHPNCRHSHGPWFEGISYLPENLPDPVESRLKYEAEQKQRYMERQVRRYKRLEAGSIDADNQAKYGLKVREWQGNLREHLRGNPYLRRNYSREKVQGGITPRQRNEILRKAVENAKIEEIREFIKSNKQPKNIFVGRQNKHIFAAREFKQKQANLSKKGEYGPAYVTLDKESIQMLVDRYHGTGEIRLNGKGEWDKKELILDNPIIIGKAIDNRSGKTADTAVFKIHYADNGVHIVPDYPSKKKGR